MVIKKAQYNHYNDDKSYDTLHLETQVEQVKLIDADGKEVGTLKEELSTINGSITKISNIIAPTGQTENLSTNAKTVISAINELKDDLEEANSDLTKRTDSNLKLINTNKTKLTELENNLKSHNHDSVYLKLKGGVVTGTIAMENGHSVSGRNTSGSNLAMIKITTSNNLAVGNATTPAFIYSKDGVLKVGDGTKTYEVFHAGNTGAGSGLDADKLDGLQGSAYPKLASVNTFKANQHINDGKNLYLNAESGSKDVGAIYFRDGSGNQLSRISVGTTGHMYMTANGINGHTFKNTGQLLSNYSHELNASDREVRSQFYRSGDSGIGLAMSTSGAFSMYDWGKGHKVFGVDRTKNVVQFTNGIELGGKRITVSASAPSSPTTGDIWFDI